MGKPSIKELRESDRFEPVEVRVECYRDAETGNLYFVPDNEEIVLDKYVQVVDTGGLPAVARRRAPLEGFGPRILRGAVSIFAAKELGIPLKIAQELLNVAEKDQREALALESVVRSFDDKDYRRGALKLADWLGPRQAAAFVADLESDQRFMTEEEFRDELASILSGFFS